MVRMKRWGLLTLWVLSIGVNPSWARDLLLYQTSRSLAMGGAAWVVDADWGSPSTLVAAEQRWAFHLGYQNQYALKQLSTYRLAVAYRFPWMENRLHLSRFGYDLYNETLLSYNMSKQLARGWAVGLRINAFSLHFPDRSDYYSLSPEVSFTYSHQRQWGVSGHWVAPFDVNWHQDDFSDLLSPIYRLGGYYRIKNCVTAIALSHSRQQPFSAGWGIEYLPMPSLPLRLGISTAPFLPSAGIGWHWGKGSIDASFSWHTVLGVSSSIQLTWTL